VTRLLVVYDAGAATPREIAAGLRTLGDVTFGVPASAATPRLLTIMAELGGVVTLEAGVAEQVRALAAQAPDAILTYSDRELRHTAALAEGLGLLYHSVATAELLTDKHRQREALRAAGVDRVRSCPLTRPDELPAAIEAVGLPAVVKPRRGASSRNTFLVSEPEHGAALVRALLAPDGNERGERELVVEELLRGRDCAPYGDYVSVESLTRDGEVTHVAVSGKMPLAPPFREVGQFWPAALSRPDRQAVEDLARGALRALGVRVGVSHTEIKLTPDGPHIIEVNGRLGGTINELSLTAGGPDLIEAAGRLALGLGPQPFAVPDDEVSYVLFNLAPTARCTLESVDGARQVRALPGVRTYRTLIRPGSTIEGGVHSEWLDLLYGRAADHATMLARMDTALDTLRFTFGLPSGPVTVRARSLRQRWEDIAP